MSAWVHDVAEVDDRTPIPYSLSERHWDGGSSVLLTPVEVAAFARVSVDRVQAAARSGALSATKVGRCWLIEQFAVVEWVDDRVARAAARRRVLAAPLLEAIAGRGGRAACGVVSGSADDKALDRATCEGVLTEQMADRLATRLLGLTPLEVWAKKHQVT